MGLKIEKTIQMVPFTDGHSLFILDYDQESGEMEFRSSNNTSLRRKDVAMASKGMVYVGLDMFPVSFLENFMNTNNQ